MTADKQATKRLLKIARGQLDGIIDMIDNERYCIDIANQLLATTSILRKVNKQIINSHMKTCVSTAFKNGDADEKINELMMIIDKISK